MGCPQAGRLMTTSHDDEPINQPTTSRSAPTPSSGGSLKSSMKKTGGGWKWPWTKEKVLEGERNVWLNDQARNIGEGYPNNYVSTSKYNLVTFMPKFLVEQFSKYANLFFLFTAFIQQVPGVSPTNRYTTIAPLSLVLLASAFKEVSEDLKRHQSDAELNSRTCQVLDPNTVSFVSKAWKDVRVGDLIRIESDDFIPADVLLISSSEPEGLSYIETSNLDGETNLKIKQASHHTSHLTSAAAFARLAGHLRSEQPNNSLYTYEGTLELSKRFGPSGEGLRFFAALGPLSFRSARRSWGTRTQSTGECGQGLRTGIKGGGRLPMRRRMGWSGLSGLFFSKSMVGEGRARRRARLGGQALGVPVSSRGRQRSAGMFRSGLTVNRGTSGLINCDAITEFMHVNLPRGWAGSRLRVRAAMRMFER
ncbi:hypothetical protein B0J17DRAFT_679905 [Rhizoctonia solani]|nr:hypothetical protein B0J17DRAFT_679905 [Rhizoctonia solani]